MQGVPRTDCQSGLGSRRGFGMADDADTKQAGLETV
jgi:hypothetical protein